MFAGFELADLHSVAETDGLSRKSAMRFHRHSTLQPRDSPTVCCGLTSQCACPPRQLRDRPDKGRADEASKAPRRANHWRAAGARGSLFCAAGHSRSGAVEGLDRRLRQTIWFSGRAMKPPVKSADCVAGAGGFEPPHGGIKIRCLTAWRRPNTDNRNESPAGGRTIMARACARNHLRRRRGLPKSVS